MRPTHVFRREIKKSGRIARFSYGCQTNYSGTYFLGMLVPVPPVVPVEGVVALPGTVDDGIVVLCGTLPGCVVAPGMELRGTLLLLGGVPCGVFGIVVGSVVVDGVVVVLPGTVLCGTVEGCKVPEDELDDGWVTELPGRVPPGSVEGCTVLPGTVLGWVVLPGYVDGCVVLGLVDGCTAPVGEDVPVDGVVWANASVLPVTANAIMLNFKAFMTIICLVDERF